MGRQIGYALIFLALFTLVTGILYPLVVTGLSQILFRNQANGSLIMENSVSVGSILIGQSFDDPAYFWGRLSATSITPYNAAASSGSNLGPSSPELRQAVQERIEALQAVDPDNGVPIPVDLVTFSASGLDPDISIAAANYQINRVARYRNLTAAQITMLVEKYTRGRQFGILGEPRVNVLLLNLALDRLP
jgi:potassium-transporting ATPase KdpC subunit